MLTLTPAYGRDYKSRQTVINDLRANRDFVVADIVSPDCGRVINLEALRS